MQGMVRGSAMKPVTAMPFVCHSCCGIVAVRVQYECGAGMLAFKIKNETHFSRANSWKFSDKFSIPNSQFV